jgi:hypothetical protein
MLYTNKDCFATESIMNHNQQGFSLTEIAIACGVLATMVIGGLSFYNNQIAKSQANWAMIASKVIMNHVIDTFSQHAALPDYTVYPVDDVQYIAAAMWTPMPKAIASTTNDWGFIDIEFDTTNIHGSLANKHVYFLFEINSNLSFLEYKGCATSSQSGAMTTLVDGDQSAILPCKYYSTQDPITYHAAFGIT